MSDKNKDELSERQQSILDFIQSYGSKMDRPPTIREIGKKVDISSTSVVNYNLNKLKEKGFVERNKKMSRGLRLTDKARALYDATVKKVEETAIAVERFVSVPLVGDIVASEPLEVGHDDFSTYDDEDMLDLSASLIKGRPEDLFALRVRGDSMIDAMVDHGDIVVMQRQTEAHNGDMVAVWLSNGQGTTTLKYFYNEGERVRLQPANKTMEPIYVDPSEVEVQGKVMMVLRQTA